MIISQLGRRGQERSERRSFLSRLLANPSRIIIKQERTEYFEYPTTPETEYWWNSLEVSSQGQLWLFFQEEKEPSHYIHSINM